MELTTYYTVYLVLFYFHFSFYSGKINCRVKVLIHQVNYLIKLIILKTSFTLNIIFIVCSTSVWSYDKTDIIFQGKITFYHRCIFTRVILRGSLDLRLEPGSLGSNLEGAYSLARSNRNLLKLFYRCE